MFQEKESGIMIYLVSFLKMLNKRNYSLKYDLYCAWLALLVFKYKIWIIKSCESIYSVLCKDLQGVARHGFYKWDLL